MDKVSTTAVIRDEVIFAQSGLLPEQSCVTKSWLEDSASERWRNNVKRMVLVALEDDL